MRKLSALTMVALLTAVLSMSGPAMAISTIQEETGHLLIGTALEDGGYGNNHAGGFLVAAAGYDGVSQDFFSLSPETAGQAYTLVAETGIGVLEEAPDLNICFWNPAISVKECHTAQGPEAGTVPSWIAEGDADDNRLAYVILQDGFDVTYRFQVTE